MQVSSGAPQARRPKYEVGNAALRHHGFAKAFSPTRPSRTPRELMRGHDAFNGPGGYGCFDRHQSKDF